MNFIKAIVCLPVIACSLLIPEVQSATLRVSPTSVSLDSEGGATAVRIRNVDTIPTTIQIVTKPWGDETDQDFGATKIFAFPPIFDLPPGAEQVVRIAAKGSQQNSSEKALVLIIKEVPQAVLPNDSGLAFVLNVELPLFVTPSNARSDPHWQIKEKTPGNPILILKNAGNAHIRLDSLLLLSTSEDQPYLSINRGSYALAGSELIWPLERNLADLKGYLRIEAQTSNGPIETIVDLPEG